MAGNKEMLSVNDDALFSESSYDNPSTFGISSTHILQEEKDLQDFLVGGGNPSSVDEIVPIEESPKPQEKKQQVVKNSQAPAEQEDTSIDDYLQEEEEDDETPAPASRKKLPTPKQKEEIVEEDEPEETTFGSLSKDLMQLGVFTEMEEETPITSAEQFLARFNEEIEARTVDYLYNNVLSRFGQEGIDMFEAIFINGVHPQEYLGHYNEMSSVKDLDLTDETNQEHVVREYYKSIGWPKEKIDSKVKKLKDLYDLQDEAETVHERLVESEQAQLEATKQQAQLRQQQIAQVRQQYGNNISTILNEKLKTKEFDGIPVTPKVAESAFDFLYTEKYQLQNGERLTDFDRYILELRKPENHAKKVKLALLAMNDLDLSKVEAKAISKKNDNLFDSLARQQKVQKRSNPTPPTNSFLNNL